MTRPRFGSGFPLARRAVWAVGLASVTMIGCAPRVSSQPTTRIATDVDPQEARADYWYAQPAVTEASGPVFEALWQASRQAIHAYHFTIDQTDYRRGVLTTAPMLSKQFWEIWRNDVVDLGHLAESSLATERRTIRLEFQKQAGGGYVVCPKVLIERYSLAERRVTSVLQYRETLQGAISPTQTLSSGEQVQSAYWYAVGRDHDFERALARRIGRRVGS